MELTYTPGGDALSATAVQPVYLFYGAEDRLKAQALATLSARVVAPDSADFDIEALDASTATAAQILSAAGQMPFGSDRRLVVVRGMEQWRDRSRASEAERLAAGLARLADSVCLVLVAAAEEEEERRKTAVTPKLDGAVREAGALVSFPALRGEALARWVTDAVRREGKKIDRAAIEKLLQMAGSEMRALEHEIVKLVCYVGNAPSITADDVAAVTVAEPEDVMFATVDAIVQRKPDRALGLLADLHRYETKPQAVAGRFLALLARQYRMLWQAKLLAERRIDARSLRSLPPEIAAELPTEGSITQVAFKAGEVFAQARRYDRKEIAQALENLLLCDLANKGGVTEETGPFGQDVVTNLQVLVVQLTNSPMQG